MSRRALHWDRVRAPLDWASVVIGTALGAGLSPVAPGTAGTLIALPLAYVSNTWDTPSRLALWIGLTILGTWACKHFDQLMQTGDNQNLVIDEVVGLGITAWTAGQDWKCLAAAFVLFRAFDILKPFPVRLVDAWSKTRASRGDRFAAWYGGWGVMGDDVVAGFQGLGSLVLLQLVRILPTS